MLSEYMHIFLLYALNHGTILKGNRRVCVTWFIKPVSLETEDSAVTVNPSLSVDKLQHRAYI